MTNRGAANLNIEIRKPTDSDKITNVSISLERAVAKIELTQKQRDFSPERSQRRGVLYHKTQHIQNVESGN